jgi:pyrroloquinoline quinone biosynthesis protein E
VFDSGITAMPEYSLKDIDKILKETKELGGKRIDITGGEATLRKDIDKIIALAKSYGYKTELVTNGSQISRDKLLRWKSINLDSIAISLDGSNYKIYSKIRKVNKKIYLGVLKAIRESVRLGFYTKINTVVFKSNLSDISNIAEWCIKNKVQELGLYYFTPMGRGDSAKEQAVEPLKWLSFIRKRLKHYKNTILKISFETPLIERKYWNPQQACIANNNKKSHLQILPDSNVYPCAILASYHKPVANLSRCSIKKLWRDKKRWEKYWQVVSKIHRLKNGSCINFKESFQISNYNLKKYRFVCPLKKFMLADFI